MDGQTAVREKYASIARTVTQSLIASCCGLVTRRRDPITKDLSRVMEKDALPERVVLASLGCGNPTALIELKEGETVLERW